MTTQAVNQPGETEAAEKPVSYAHPLDEQAYSGNDLGAVYSKRGTTFKVWAPTASGVAVKLYKTGSPAEAGAQDVSTTAMKKQDNGVWSVTLNGDKKNLYYTYLVTIDGVTTETADVYSKAVGVNGNRSMVVDLPSTNPEGWEKDQHILCDHPTDAVVWEIHVRDFSSDEASGISIKHRGKYLAFTETGTTLAGKEGISTGIDYLKKLGITHVQLLPVYDYATVDETHLDSDEYNWGYDPKNYNVPEGSYSTNPYDGNVRIREFKQMVQALHQAGIGVIMDVVYNHSYSAKGSCFENTVPGYYFRMNPDGTFADASACGNEAASDHLMYRKYMIDSVLYWINEYHIDGFRFDLMGVLDVETMNQLRAAVDQQVEHGDKILLYGEPWAASAVATKAKTCTKENIRLLSDRIGAFNDNFRDAVKGHVFNGREGGFVQSGAGKALVIDAIAANTMDSSAWLKQPSQSVTYISAHDNYTLYDKLVLSVKNDDSFTQRDETLVAMNRLAAAITLTSQGISFMQAGEEFARTKLGDENSYISPDRINKIDWNCLVQYADLQSYYQGLIELRRSFAPFRDPKLTSAQKMTFSETPDGVVAYTIENVLTAGKEWKTAALLFNASETDAEVTLKTAGETVPDKWVVVVNGVQAGITSLGELSGTTVTVPAGTALVLVDKESFDKAALVSNQCVVTVQYQETGSGEVIRQLVLKGQEGDGYVSEEDHLLDVAYDYQGVDGKPIGTFTRAPQTVTYRYLKYPGAVRTLTVRYLTKGDAFLGTDDVELFPPLVRQVREGDYYAADIKTLSGMEVDMSLFPHNAAGKMGEGDVEVCYYYKKAQVSDLIIHYFDSENMGTVYACVTAGLGDEAELLTDPLPGKEMAPDASKGEGWFVLTLKDLGSEKDLQVRFSSKDGKITDNTSYSVSREVWISYGTIVRTSELHLVCLRSDGTLLDDEVIYGKSGDTYTVTEREYDDMKLVSTTDNTTGVFGGDPVYVLCYYDKKDIQEKPVMKIILILCGSALATLGAAAVIGGLYRSRKKRWGI